MNYIIYLLLTLNVFILYLIIRFLLREKFILKGENIENDIFITDFSIYANNDIIIPSFQWREYNSGLKLQKNENKLFRLLNNSYYLCFLKLDPALVKRGIKINNDLFIFKYNNEVDLKIFLHNFNINPVRIKKNQKICDAYFIKTNEYYLITKKGD